MSIQYVYPCMDKLSPTRDEAIFPIKIKTFEPLMLWSGYVMSSYSL